MDDYEDIPLPPHDPIGIEDLIRDLRAMGLRGAHDVRDAYVAVRYKGADEEEGES